MALVGNHSLINRVICRQFAGGVSSGYAECYVDTGSQQNRLAGGFANFAATPIGYTHPIAWVMPRTSGGLASLQQLSASGTVSNAVLARGIGLLGNAITASISQTNAALAVIVGLDAAMSASVSTTNAQLALTLALASSITATGTVTTADLGNILNLTSALVASGVLTQASVVTLTNLAASISSNTALSPDSLAQAVWSSVSASYDAAGTMGEKLNDAGAAGNPWAALVDSNNAPGTFGERTQKLLKLAQFLGLK